MKKALLNHLKKSLIIILVLSMVLTNLTITVLAKDEPVENVYYEHLTADEKAVYNQMLECINKLVDDFEPVKKISADSIVTIEQAILNDHPEIFWYGQDVTFRGGLYRQVDEDNNLKEVRMAFNEYAKKDGELDEKTLVSNQKELADMTDEIIGPAKDMTDAEKELYLHNYLCNKLMYDYDNLAKGKVEVEKTGDQTLGYKYVNNTVLGVLSSGLAICDGYARTFQYLLNKAGVINYYVFGTGLSGENYEKSELHAWNVVYIKDEIAGDNLYNIDITWDDYIGEVQGWKKQIREENEWMNGLWAEGKDVPEEYQYVSTRLFSYISMGFFNVSQSVFVKTHKVDSDCAFVPHGIENDVFEYHFGKTRNEVIFSSFGGKVHCGKADEDDIGEQERVFMETGEYSLIKPGKFITSVDEYVAYSRKCLLEDNSCLMNEYIMIDGLDVIKKVIDPLDDSKKKEVQDFLMENIFRPVAECLGFNGLQVAISNTYWSTFDNDCFFCDIYQAMQPVKRKEVEKMATYLEWITEPTKTEYEYASALSTLGGKYKVHFNDGSSESVDVKASMVSGFNSYQPGTHILTVRHNSDVVAGNTLTYKVKIGPSNGQGPLRGDADGSGTVDSDDAIFVLMSTLFGDDYKPNQDIDFDGNGAVDSDDAIYLLMHTLFAEDYPLKNAGYTE